MPYYETIAQDLERAKDILERGALHPADLPIALREERPYVAGGTIYGVDTYAAYKLLESFVTEIEDLHRSFELYHAASMALMRAYQQTHPDVPADVWPGTAQVNDWAAKEIERLQADRQLASDFIIEIVEGVTGASDWKGSMEDARRALSLAFDNIRAVRAAEAQDRALLLAIQNELVVQFYDPDPADPTPELNYATVDWLGVIRQARQQIDRLKADGERERAARRIVDEVLRQERELVEAVGRDVAALALRQQRARDRA